MHSYRPEFFERLARCEAADSGKYAAILQNIRARWERGSAYGRDAGGYADLRILKKIEIELGLRLVGFTR